MTKSSLRLVHLTSVHRTFDVRIFDKHCRTSVEAGDEVVLVSTHDRDEVVDGVVIKSVPKRSHRLLRMTLTAWQVYRTARRQQADLYVIHDPELLPWARLLRWTGHRVIYDMHENVPKDILSKTWIPAWLRKPLACTVRYVERLLIGKMPVLFAESSYVASYPWVENSAVIRNCAKLDLSEPVAREGNPPTLAYIGAVSRDRGSVVTLEALKLLAERGLSVGWLCIGPISPAEHESELLSFVEKHGLSRVEFTGYIKSSQAIKRIADCTIGIAVLQPEPNFVESYPTKIFEYMALGMPVVTSRFPLYQEVIEQSQCGVCVDPTDANEIADAIESLVQQPELSQQYGDRGRQAVVETYNWGVEFKKLRTFYEQVLLSSRSR